MSQNEELMLEDHRNLEKQIYQLITYGNYSEQYICSLDTHARNYAFELVEEKLEKEKKQNEAEAKKIKSSKTTRRPTR